MVTKHAQSLSPSTSSHPLLSGPPTLDKHSPNAHRILTRIHAAGANRRRRTFVDAHSSCLGRASLRCGEDAHVRVERTERGLLQHLHAGRHQSDY